MADIDGAGVAGEPIGLRLWTPLEAVGFTDGLRWFALEVSWVSGGFGCPGFWRFGPPVL